MFNGDVNLILMDGCKVKAEQSIVTYGTHTLKIYAQSEGAKMGSLEAVGTSSYPAIGGGGPSNIAPVEIHGGLVSASGTGISAAIGGGADSPGQVTIYGGIVSASVNKNDSQGAAIGGGQGHNDSTVNIYGGTVSAFTNGKGAAIGGGQSGAGIVNIFGGTVNARSEYSGAAIGGGGQAAGTVNIYGGTVNARSERSGAAIGGGGSGSGGDGTVNIYGGTVNASIIGNCDGAAIGGGNWGIGEITISCGIVDAVSTSYAGCAAIGNGNPNYGSSTSGGFVTVTGGKVRATSSSAANRALGGTGCNISLGWTNTEDFIFTSGYTGTVTLTNTLIDVKSGEAVNNANFAGKMLVPLESNPQNYWTGADFVLPDELTAVGASAFAGIPAKAVLVPASVGNVGNSAFANSGVMMIRFLGNSTGIEPSAFSGCGMLFAFAPDNSQTMTDLRKISNVVPIAMPLK